MKSGKLSSIVFLLISTPSFATGVSEYLYYQEGQVAISKEQAPTALGSFLKALQEDPLNPKIHHALGLSLLAAQKPDQAVKAFRTAVKLSQSPEEKFQSLFNAGVAATANKDVDGALDFYQQALELNPHSLETKTNMELLIQQEQQSDKGDQGKEGDKGDPNKDKGKGQGQGDDQDQKQPQQPEQGEDQKQPEEQKKQPPKFESPDLDTSDVKKILDELKSQEQGIRAREYEKGQKERSGGKDW